MYRYLVMLSFIGFVQSVEFRGACLCHPDVRKDLAKSHDKVLMVSARDPSALRFVGMTPSLSLFVSDCEDTAILRINSQVTCIQLSFAHEFVHKSSFFLKFRCFSLPLGKKASTLRQTLDFFIVKVQVKNEKEGLRSSSFFVHWASALQFYVADKQNS